jgi:cytosine/adenosine deaminase-related metal-dependent hydrolase
MTSASRSIAYENATLVTMDPARRVLRADLWVVDGRIAAIGGPFPEVRDRVDCTGAWIVPGFVQTHLHLCQALFRGLAEEADLLAWLRGKIWPLEAAHDEASVALSARLGLCEAIRNGTTTLFDKGTVRHTEKTAEAALESGIRVFVGKALMDGGDGVPDGLRDTAAEALAGARALFDAFDGRGGGLLRVNLSPRFILSCSPELWRGVARASAETGALVHTHLNESRGEIAAIERAVGSGAVAFFDGLGLLNERFVGAHGVWFTDEERKRMADAGARVSHCPSSNFKLASGACDVKALREAGVVVGLGADGAPCNNRIDPFAEMRLAGLVSRSLRADEALTAEDVVALATIDGARSLGLEQETGSLEAGKTADFVVLEAQGSADAPLAGTDPYTALVYQMSSAAVRTVVCRGEVVCHRGRVRAWDDAEIVAQADEARRAVVRRAGLESLLATAPGSAASA